jgi:hypothetical protein
MDLATGTSNVPENSEVDRHKPERIAKCNWSLERFGSSVDRKPFARHAAAFAG